MLEETVVIEIFIVVFRGNRGCRRFNRSMSRSYGIRQHFYWRFNNTFGSRFDFPRENFSTGTNDDW
jgi:hypothetical protein